MPLIGETLHRKSSGGSTRKKHATFLEIMGHIDKLQIGIPVEKKIKCRSPWQMSKDTKA